MKLIFIVALAAALSGGVGAVATLALVDRQAPALAHDSDATLVAAVRGIEERQAQIDGRLEELDRKLDSGGLQASSPTATRLPEGEIIAAVESYLAERGESVEEALAPGVVDVAGAPAGFDLDAAFTELMDPDLEGEHKQFLWEQAREAGMTDELVAMFEKRATDNPNDPTAQVDLGQAYLHKVFEAGQGPAAGMWATRADQSFETALSLDEGHWDARFSKAVSLSFWPPAMGKQGEAIQQFEILKKQQESLQPESGHAQTYLFLGNMYQQIGNMEKALSTWSEGLLQFPDAQSLQDQIDNNS